eukprot:1803336-Heterocapsa_arctica.AAC.1
MSDGSPRPVVTDGACLRTRRVAARSPRRGGRACGSQASCAGIAARLGRVSPRRRPASDHRQARR